MFLYEWMMMASRARRWVLKLKRHHHTHSENVARILYNRANDVKNDDYQGYGNAQR